MKFYIACIQKLNETLKNSAIAKKNLFIGCPSLRVFESNDFLFLSAATNTEESLLKAEDISMQFNSLSASKNFWDVDPNLNLFELYKESISNLKLEEKKPTNSKLDNELNKLYKADKTPTVAFRIYNKKREEYEKLLDRLGTLTTELHETDEPKLEEVLRKQIDQLQLEIKLHVTDWKNKGHKAEIEEILDRANEQSEYDTFLADIKRIENEIKNSEKTGIKSLNTYSKIQLVPHNFYEVERSWNSIEIEENEVEALFERAKISQKGFYNDLLNFDYEEDYIKKITLQYNLVNIKRSWFYPTILESDFIKKPTNQTGYYYAQKVLLIKKLRIMLKDSLPNKEKAKIEANSVIKFGPIFMKNQFFTNKKTKEAFIKPVTNKLIYGGKIAAKVDKKLFSLSDESKALNTIVASSRSIKVGPFKIDGAEVRPPRPKPKKAKAKSLVIVSAKWVNQVSESVLHFDIRDKLSNSGIYKAEISIKDNKSSYFKEAETDENGKATVKVPKRDTGAARRTKSAYYYIQIRKNGYKEIGFWNAIAANRNININKQLEPQEVVYDSFFLIGIVGTSTNL